MLLSPSRFQQVLSLAPCPQIETCHPEADRRSSLNDLGVGSRQEGATAGKCSGGLPKPASLNHQKKHSAAINQMVNSRFPYFSGKRHASMSAQSPGGRAGSTIFLLSSTEV